MTLYLPKGLASGRQWFEPLHLMVGVLTSEEQRTWGPELARQWLGDVFVATRQSPDTAIPLLELLLASLAEIPHTVIQTTAFDGPAIIDCGIEMLLLANHPESEAFKDLQRHTTSARLYIAAWQQQARDIFVRALAETDADCQATALEALFGLGICPPPRSTGWEDCSPMVRQSGYGDGPPERSRGKENAA